ncbi:tryptophan--tRNA ligase [Coprothermobacteraceae bacterium]|nr:tryptophan--tRNA ligase [Coprothermobacteraceae bacterium]
MDRVVSGMRPTGVPHLGNLQGALRKWVELQDSYESFYFIADWHALFGLEERSREIKQNTKSALATLLAIGLDPEKSTIFVQSQVPEHTILFTIFSAITPTGWLGRNPTLKDMVRADEPLPYGLLGYPVLQAADILLYKGTLVPVGKDQMPHLEITREIARRFNSMYGVEYFPEPQAVLNESPVLPGIDGRKMSKSYGNIISIEDDFETIKSKVRLMITDPQKIRKSDPGHPDICTVFQMEKSFVSTEYAEDIFAKCVQGALGCVAHKDSLAKIIWEYLSPIREKYFYYMSHPEELVKVANYGAGKARKIAAQTIEEVLDITGVVL